MGGWGDGEYVRGRPAPAVRPVVPAYVGYRLTGCDPGTHQGLPGPTLTTVVSLADPVELTVMPDPGQRPARFRALVSGLHTRPATVRRTAVQHGVHLDLDPLGARALLGAPPSALGSSVVELDDLLGGLAGELVERLAAAPTWGVRFAVLDDVLTRRLTAAPPPVLAPELTRAWRRLVEAGGALRVDDVAREVGWSRRHLGARFRAELGLSPKAAARTLRLDRSRRLLASLHPPSLADVAVMCGYADQAHLTREWRALAGMTPGAWRAEEVPKVQDAQASAAG